MTIERLIGTKLGSYAIRELIDNGGMASVYKGYDPALDREVAIKVLGTVGQPPDFVARFQREARVVARLRHPNIVQIYHFGVQGDVVYMVQELLTGPTLARRIQQAGRRRIVAERIHSIIGQFAAALDFAHGQGVIHRDVKPSNAIYNAHGQLVLTDFGIAHGLAEAALAATKPGVIMGTPGYLAPEQAISSATLTPASDIYALGVVLFELLTGRLPFEADTPMGVVLKHLYEEPPPPSHFRSGLPPALDALVLRALSKEPSERYPSAGVLARALEAAWPIGATSSANRKPAAQSAQAPATPTKRVAKPQPASTAAAKPKRTAPATNNRRAAPERKNAALPARPVHYNRRRTRVALLTIDLVAALLLFGARPNALAEAWAALMRLLGSG
ncbi:MAG TPA: protein kinase [Roseiflexaceae bacterium]|nr:protein kinase [Roseiflexaceae bacterium]